jgi:hypothetical protein
MYFKKIYLKKIPIIFLNTIISLLYKPFLRELIDVDVKKISRQLASVSDDGKKQLIT